MAAPLGLRGDFDAPGLRALAAGLPADRLLFKDDLHPAFASYDQILSTGHDFLFGPNRHAIQCEFWQRPSLTRDTAANTKPAPATRANCNKSYETHP